MGPLIPRPAVTLIALTLTGALIANMLVPALQNDNSGRNSVILALLISGILGFELYGRRGRGGDQK